MKSAMTLDINVLDVDTILVRMKCMEEGNDRTELYIIHERVDMLDAH